MDVSEITDMSYERRNLQTSLNSTEKEGSEYHQEVFSMCTKVMTSIRKIPVPVIAQVSGVAAAAGCQLIASCDIVIASNISTFSTPGGNVGLFCSTPGIAVSRAVPQKVSALMLFGGEPISADDALKSGLVSKVVSPEALESETNKVVQSILDKSRSVIELGKLFYYKQIEMPIAKAYEEGESIMVENLKFADAQEGIAAFIKKRKPKWSHTKDAHII
ncbi:Enoyl-CoA hydratase domain-containing protein 3, mitochondrial [Nymphon striatum]|nr:Enoyl-CoA hydratase domain-containing protein 3, mitochondrial [Nymphon striatum]